MDDEKKTKENSQKENNKKKSSSVEGARYAVKIRHKSGLEFVGYADNCQKLIKVAIRLYRVIPVIEEKLKEEEIKKSNQS